MKAFGYLIAGAALLSTSMAQIALLKSPAPNSALSNGWRYKGCYTDVAANIVGNHALANGPTALNPNGGVQCTNTYCGNTINPNNTVTAGILSLDASCLSACQGNTNEVCGTTDTFLTIYEFTAFKE
ncbi:hypothetical protein E8E13_005076 [Curvularia kusanoi]|uniref:WSC domain-containing protein n=1 Tax=Curvularia kusanoi TaxID=90978 RepID=A0A9P4TFE0_CURKU|nr:hypothetical protein E8E13_005076 [Curvularia kusanoi]